MIQKLIETITRHIPEKHIAIGHDWLLGVRGGEKVLQAIAQCFPKATIYTLFYDKVTVRTLLGLSNPIRASFLNKLPFVRHYYRYLFLLFPWAIRRLSVSSKRLILSSSHTLIKNLHSKNTRYSIAYIHAPLRFLYARKLDYKKFSLVYRFLEPLFSPWLKRIQLWDKNQHQNIHLSLCNSDFIAEQVQKIYHCPSKVIHPFYNQALFKLPAHQIPFQNRSYFLWVGAFVPYKLPQLVLEAFSKLNQTLILVGAGPLYKKLRNQYSSPKIQFRGWQPDETLPKLYQNAKALIFPGIEDFGIVPLEAAACGCPVIAYPEGGVTETLGQYLWPIRTQGVEGICYAIQSFKPEAIDLPAMTNSVKRFSKEAFLKNYLSAVTHHVSHEKIQQPSPTV